LEITTVSKEINSVYVVCNRTGSPPPLVVEIRDATTNELIASGTKAAGEIPTSTSIVNIPLPLTTLTVGSKYRVILNVKAMEEIHQIVTI
jgi:hypothetical protein